jgi:carboxylesterase
MARALHARGYDVRVPLLPGHGRTVQDFDASSHAEWIESALAELLAMRARYGWVALGGLSMGGAIAAVLAGEVRDIPSLVLMAPYLAMPMHLRIAASSARFWSGRVGPLHSRTERSIHDPVERAANLAYGAVTGRALHQLSLVVKEARAALPRIVAPTLLIQSREDNRIPPQAARWAIHRIGATRKRLVLTHGAGHIITVDYGREQVLEEVGAWLGSGPGTTP